MLSMLLYPIIIVIIIIIQLFILTGHSSQQTRYQTHERKVKQAAYSSANSDIPLLRTALHILLQWNTHGYVNLKFLNQTGTTITKCHKNNLSFLPPTATETQTTPQRQVTKFDIVCRYSFKFEWYVRMETAYVGFTMFLPDCM
jgi:hypothetical protein